jgi:outer membrane protein assembly factor BamA
MGNRFFLGGPGSARGFGFRRLGPPGARAALSEVQVGGDYEIFAAVDARIQAHPVFYVSPFLEVGRVWASGLDQTSETGRVLQQGIRVEDLQPVSGLTFTIANAGRWIEVSTGVRLLNNSGLADPVPRMAIQLRLRPDPRK